MLNVRRGIFLPMLALTCLAGVGCEIDNNNDDDRDQRRERRERINRRDTDRDDRVVGRTRDRDREVDVDIDRPLDPRRDRDVDRPLDRDTDRERDRNVKRREFDVIPPRAVRLQSTPGTREAAYTAERDGRIYVYDVDDGAVVYSSRLYSNEQFVLDPDDNVATINGRTVLDKDLKATHRFRLYYAVD